MHNHRKTGREDVGTRARPVGESRVRRLGRRNTLGGCTMAAGHTGNSETIPANVQRADPRNAGSKRKTSHDPATLGSRERTTTRLRLETGGGRAGLALADET